MTDIASKLRFIISQDGWVDIQEVDVDSQVNEIEALIADECRKARLIDIDELITTVINSPEYIERQHLLRVIKLRKSQLTKDKEG